MLTVEITDDVPEHFEHGKLPIRAEIPAHSEHVFEYTLKPLKRGEYVFPAVTVRYPGVIGLIRRKKKFPTPDSRHRVYPNIRDLSDYDMAALSQNLLVSGIKLEGVISGHDQYSMTLTDDHGCQQLIYKAKISTITIANTSEKPQHKPGYKQFHRQPRNNYQQNQQ